MAISRSPDLTPVRLLLATALVTSGVIIVSQRERILSLFQDGSGRNGPRLNLPEWGMQNFSPSPEPFPKTLPFPIEVNTPPLAWGVPAGDPVRQVAEGIPAARRGTVEVWGFPADGGILGIPVYLPGVDLKLAEKLRANLVALVTGKWQGSFDKGRRHVSGVVPQKIGGQEVFVHQIDTGELRRTIESYPGYDARRGQVDIYVDGSMETGVPRTIRVDEAVTMAQTSAWFAREVAAVLAENGTNIRGATFGPFGSMADGRADPEVSDFDTMITVRDASQYQEILEMVELLAHEGGLSPSLRSAYEVIRPGRVRANDWAHIVVFLVNETNQVVGIGNEVVRAGGPTR